MNNLIRKTHGALGLIFGVFLLIQGFTAFLLAFEKPLEKAWGENNVKLIEKIHKGKIYKSWKAPYNAATGLALVYLSLSGISMGVLILSRKKAKKAA